jgi:hypothetical protein
MKLSTSEKEVKENITGEESVVYITSIRHPSDLINVAIIRNEKILLMRQTFERKTKL